MKEVLGIKNRLQDPYYSKSCLHNPGTELSIMKSFLYLKNFSRIRKKPPFMARKQSTAPNQIIKRDNRRTHSSIFHPNFFIKVSKQNIQKRKLSEITIKGILINKGLYRKKVDSLTFLNRHTVNRKKLFTKLLESKKAKQQNTQDEPLSFRNSKAFIKESDNTKQNEVIQVAPGIFYLPNKPKRLPFLNQKIIDFEPESGEIKTPHFMGRNTVEESSKFNTTSENIK